ncbi:hypothetical protein [Mesorhizobium sp.]|uniref:hypothetical protein n=1 Tax=Mesorhizobium sp. TaxID=1871066 RepID=UPI00120886C0|nr:hypothetical protein [Mesorhizobium sp.]TIL29499.1 MAG: hypothetical protein E5Y85_27415 [Mesorhizobium sp.]
MSRYNEDQMNENASPKPATMPTMAEFAVMNITPAERETHIDKMRHAAAVADHNEKEALMKAQIAAATEVSLAGNQWYQVQQRGQLSQRVSVSNGKTTVEQLNAKADPSSSAFAIPPRALVDSLPVTIGGIQLGPKQARQMVEAGEDQRQGLCGCGRGGRCALRLRFFPLGSFVQEQPLGEAPEVAVEREDDDDQDLDADDKAKAEQAEYDEMVSTTDKILGEWTAAQPEEARQAVIDSYIEGGVIGLRGR